MSIEQENILLQDLVHAYDEYYAASQTNYISYSRADKRLQSARLALETFRKAGMQVAVFKGGK